MKRNHTLLYSLLSLLAFASVSCADSEVDTAFSPSLTDRAASFSLSVTPASFSLESELSSQNIYITSTDSWTVSSVASWISFSTTSGSGNGTVSFSVQQNASDSERSGSIIVTGVQSGMSSVVTVTQKGMSLTLDEQSLEFEYGGGTKTVNVQTDGHILVKNEANWLSCEISASSVKITALPNSEMSPRTATVYVSLENSSLSAPIEVTQYGVSGIVIGGFDQDTDWE